MKKLISFVVALLCLFSLGMPVKAAKLDIEKPKVTNHEKIKVYLFRGKGCTHCYDFLTFFEAHAKEFSKYIEIVAYETYNDADNKVLKEKVNQQYEVDEKYWESVPLIVVGDWYNMGFGDDTGVEIIEKALEFYQDDDYVDSIQKIITDEKLSHNPETLEEACEKENVPSTDSNSNGVIIVVIFAILMVGIGIIAFKANKK